MMMMMMIYFIMKSAKWYIYCGVIVVGVHVCQDSGFGLINPQQNRNYCFKPVQIRCWSDIIKIGSPFSQCSWHFLIGAKMLVSYISRFCCRSWTVWPVGYHIQPSEWTCCDSVIDSYITVIFSYIIQLFSYWSKLCYLVNIYHKLQTMHVTHVCWRNIDELGFNILGRTWVNE